MGLRRRLGCLPVALLAVCAWTACSKSESVSIQGTKNLDKRCEQLAKKCGDSDKHIDKILVECKVAAQKQAEARCADKAIAAYDCYEKDVCGQADRVWTMDDLRVLADRHSKCAAERTALDECTSRKEGATK